MRKGSRVLPESGLDSIEPAEPPVRKDRLGLMGLLALCLYLASPPLVYLVASDLKHGLRDLNLLWNIGMSVLWLAAFHAVVRRPLLLHLVLAPFYLTTGVDLFLVLRFGSRLTSSYVSIVLTDLGDTKDFLGAYATDVAAGLGMIIPSYLLGLWCIRRMRLRCPSRIRPVALILLLFGYAAVVGRQMKTFDMDFPHACLDVVTHDLSSPMGVVSQVVVTAVLMAQTDSNLEARHAFSFEARRESSGEEEIYVLVIGESARPDHWSLAGYGRDTSPLLRKLRNLVLLEDVITTSPSTSLAVPSMLSLASVEDWTAVESQRSVISAFQETGFRTAWFSTQEVSHWAGITHFVAAEADRRLYFERMRDGILVDQLRALLDSEPRPAKLFIVLHTKGSHFEFFRRYPPEYRVFPDSGGSSLQNLVNSYDNSILYTDWILSEIIGLVQARGSSALVYFASDHGENLLDDDRELFGHAIGNEYDLPTASFFWYSDRLAVRFPQKIAAARTNAAKKLSLADLPHTLLDIAGIQARGVDPSRSIFNPSFRESPRLYFSCGKVLEYSGEPLKSRR